jgi:SAM-dependent methyltransferase
MSLRTLSEWLRCPNCARALSPTGALALGCSAGHAFDVNRRGYVSLLAGSRGLRSDSSDMLDARAAFLGAGWFDPIRDAIAAVAHANTPERILDVGCGTGYYLAGVLERLPEAPALGMDLSSAAVARTLRVGPTVDGLVADAWSALPIRDNAADLILNVFAPRNVDEFHRVLRPDGRLAVVIPQQSHLVELRGAGLLLEVQPDKALHLVESLRGRFTLESRQAMSYVMELPPDAVDTVVGMGPSAHHAKGADKAVSATAPAADTQPVTAAVELFVFSPLP